MTTILEIPATESGAIVADYTPAGGKIFVLRSIEVAQLSSQATFEYDSRLLNWFVTVDDTPVQGLTDLIILPDVGITKLECFLVLASNKRLALRRYFQPSGTLTNGALYQVRFRGQLLETQNVALPWEPCNVE